MSNSTLATNHTDSLFSSSTGTAAAPATSVTVENTYHIVQYYYEHVHHARVYAPIVAIQSLLLLVLLSCLCVCLCRCARLNTQQQPRVYSPREISEASQRLLADGARNSSNSVGGSAKKKPPRR